MVDDGPRNGVRAERRQERLLAIEHAAMELFAERGYEETHVADIARRAGVSPRTVFRYFATKRDLVFAEADHHLAVLLACAAEPATPDGPAERLAAAALALARRLDGPRARLRARAAQGDAELAAWSLQTREGWAAALATPVAEATGTDRRHARLLAGLAMLALGEAVVRWTEEDERPLEDLARETLAVALAVEA